jgi:hypothetical protein
MNSVIRTEARTGNTQAEQIKAADRVIRMINPFSSHSKERIITAESTSAPIKPGDYPVACARKDQGPGFS